MATIADILLAQADLAGEAQRNRGKVLGSTLAALGEIPAEIIQQRDAAKARAFAQQMAQREADRKAANDARLVAQGDEKNALERDKFNAETNASRTAAQRAQEEEQALRGVFAQGPPTLDTLTPIVGVERATKLLTGLQALQPNPKAYGERRDVLQKALVGLSQVPEPMRAEAWPDARQSLIRNGVLEPEEAPEQYDPTWWAGAAGYGQQPKAEGVISLQEQANRALKAGDTKEYQRLKQVIRETSDAGRAPTQPAQPVDNTDTDAIADAIMRGEQPPTTTGLYGKTAAVKAALAKKGFDLTGATRDWQAMSGYMRTLNGAQQTRLRQATEFVNETVPLVRELSTGLTKALPRSRFPVLNKAAIKAAKSGIGGPEAQAAATKLDAQIADLQSELAVMYRGGNAPTDEALKKATDMLRGDWSETQLGAALDLIERNSTIRLNSIKNVGVAGMGDTPNRYAPPQTDTPPPASGGGMGLSYDDYLKAKGKK